MPASLLIVGRNAAGKSLDRCERQEGQTTRDLDLRCYWYQCPGRRFPSTTLHLRDRRRKYVNCPGGPRTDEAGCA